LIPSTERHPKRALGRGLSALIPQGPVPISGELPGRNILRLPLESICRDANQPRKVFDEDKIRGLADSIRAQGVIQPVLVRREGSGYRLIAGERRWRAAQLAGLRELPAIVREASDGEALELALVENLQRTDLNPIEEAEGYRRLMRAFSFTQEQVSQRVGRDRSSVANALRLLGLPESVRDMLEQGTLSMGHARALLGLESGSEIIALAAKVLEQKLSVRDTERWVKRVKSTPRARRSAREQKQNPHVRQVVEQLQRLLGTKVRLIDKGGRGTLEIDFFSYDGLERLLTLLRK
jgi:ParB family transcriptional regulator, chromosome partitioning protein